MKSSKILTLAIMASLLSSPCAWAAHKTGAAADAKPAAQTETVKPAKAEKQQKKKYGAPYGDFGLSKQPACFSRLPRKEYCLPASDFL